jgi:phytoene/squalene synthetase
LRPAEKLKLLNFFDVSLKKEEKTDLIVINNLIRSFKKIGFAKEYSRNLLKAFKLDAKKKRYKNWAELIYYCKYSANPVGRFFVDLCYQKKKKKLVNRKKILSASDNLCTSLQIINHLQDCKDDFKKNNRIYLPDSLFKKYSVDISNLNQKKSSEKFRMLKDEVISNTEFLLNNSKDGLKMIDIWKLKKETLIIFNIAKRLCFLLKNNDPLEKKIKLSRIDLIFCFIKGIIYD